MWRNQSALTLLTGMWNDNALENSVQFVKLTYTDGTTQSSPARYLPKRSESFLHTQISHHVLQQLNLKSSKIGNDPNTH